MWLCHPECSSSSWPFCGWSGRSLAGTTAATGRRRRNTWCCASAASRSTSSWTSSMSSSPTPDYRSLHVVSSRTKGCWGVSSLWVFGVCNPLQEPEQLRLKKRINSALAGIELLSYSYSSRCVCVCLRVHPCLCIPVMKPLRWVVQNLQNHTARLVPLSLFNKISWPEKWESSTYVAESLPACWRAFPLFYFLFVDFSYDCSVLVIQVTWTPKVCLLNSVSYERFYWTKSKWI